jgi:hypothetical protein
MTKPTIDIDVAKVIQAAATSTLGVLALLCLLIAAIAYAFFKGAGDRIKVGVFAAMFVAVIGFAVSVIRVSNDPGPVSNQTQNQYGLPPASATETPTASPSPPPSTTTLTVTPPSPSPHKSGIFKASFLTAGPDSVTVSFNNETDEPVAIETAALQCPAKADYSFKDNPDPVIGPNSKKALKFEFFPSKPPDVPDVGTCYIIINYNTNPEGGMISVDIRALKLDLLTYRGPS